MNLESGDQGRAADSGSNGNQLPSISNGLSSNNNNNGSSIPPSNGAGNNGNQVRLPPISFLSPFSNAERSDFSAGGSSAAPNGGAGAPPTFPLAQFRPQQPQEAQLPSLGAPTPVSVSTPAASQPVEVSSSGSSTIGRPDTSIGLPAPISTGVDHRRQNIGESSNPNQLPSLPGMIHHTQQQQVQQPTPPSTSAPHNHNHHHHHHHHHSHQHSNQGTVFPKTEPPTNGVHTVDPNATQEAPGEHTTLIADETVQPQQIPEQPVEKFSKKHVTVDSSDVFSYASKFPRRHIGSVYYQVNPTAKSVHRLLDVSEDVEDHTESRPNEAPKIIELLPSCIANYVNCLVDVRIPADAISDNENVIRRKLWGTDVYTDDSDIVAILHHIGILKTAPPFGEVAEEKEEVLEHDITPANTANKNDVAFLCPKEDANDLIVTVLVLPQLEQYTGSYRNNYKSRSWPGIHNGASIAVYRVAWCKSGEAAVFPAKKQRVSERIEIWTKLSKTDTIDPAWDTATRKTRA